MAEVNYESAKFEEMKKNTALAEAVVRNPPDSLKSAGEEHIKRLNALAKTS
ncbi:MAG: hypothetical protein HYT75_05265 [Deltaproteobacteria bacterium]|nr:hypothetical protein [Deltaproteobacteria bacterium]MBI2341721.1 hypothetical protein [Deltaproteobacteria bacterium]